MTEIELWIIAWCNGRYVLSKVFLDEAEMLRCYIDLGDVAKSYQRVVVKERAA